MSRNLTITMLPQNNSTNALGPSFSSWYYEKETYCDCSQTVHVSKEIQNSYKDLDIRWQIPTTITSFDPEEILRISKIASENGIKVSTSVDYMHLEGVAIHGQGHVTSQVDGRDGEALFSGRTTAFDIAKSRKVLRCHADGGIHRMRELDVVCAVDT